MLFPNNDANFKMTNWASISSNHCGQFWGRERSKLPPPSSLTHLEDVLHEERYTIPLETIQNSARGGIVVKALCYKLAGCRFDSRWCYWNFSVTQSFRSHYGPGVDSASNKNDYQVYFLGVKAAGV
jgi:hypothetical protein